MDYEGFFNNSIEQLKSEGNYRVFAELERHVGDFPPVTPEPKPTRSLSGAVTITLAWVSIPMY